MHKTLVALMLVIGAGSAILELTPKAAALCSADIGLGFQASCGSCHAGWTSGCEGKCILYLGGPTLRCPIVKVDSLPF
jgi:hypothetical protein